MYVCECLMRGDGGGWGEARSVRLTKDSTDTLAILLLNVL